jgi:hypothetical protein
MPNQVSSKYPSTEPATVDHLIEGENPRHVPEHHLGGTPPQPDVEEQSEIDQQQDQEPLDPAPILQHTYNPSGQQKELKNG